jgi:predicted TIM-barrel enzyme
MPSKFSRQEVLARLQAQIDARSSILAVGAGSGLVARCAENGGADLIIVYSSGRFRMNGLPSFVASMPIGDANAITIDLGKRDIVPHRRTVPVIGGVYAADPTRVISGVLDEIEATGYSGVINFPSVARLEGSLRREIEAAGYGFERECRMVAEARERELFSLAYVRTTEHSRMMAEAGVDVIVGHMGFTVGGDIGSVQGISLEESIGRLNEIFEAARKVRPEVMLLTHGGPIATAADVEFANLRTKAAGFVAASSFERIPIENALKQACAEFKSARVSG